MARKGNKNKIQLKTNMPKTIKNDAGEDETVYSQEELDQAAADKAEEAREAAETAKQEEIDKLTAEREADSEELEKLRNKDMNFENLRSKKNKEAGGQAGESQDEIQKRIDDTNKRLDELTNQRQADTLNDFIKDKIGEDKDKKEKFDHYYKRLGAGAKTKEEIQKAASEALTLVTGGEYNGENDQSMHSTRTTQNYREQNSGEPSEQSKQMGRALGVTEEDRKKYGKKK